MTSTAAPTPTTAPVHGITGMRREFAVLAILARRICPATVSSVREAIAESSWREVLPERYQQQAVHRALAGLEHREHVARTGAARDLWQATEDGVAFVRDHIAANPNVNPEARESRGPVAWDDCGEFAIDYDIQITAATLKALAEWASGLPGSTPLQLAVDDRMTVVAHPGGKNAFDSDGSPGSAQYVLLAPLDATGTARAAEITRPGATATGNS